MESILNETQVYVKKNLWFYGNFVCTICNPKNFENFLLDPNGSTMVYNSNNCEEFLEMSEFETRTVLIYDKFIKLFVDLGILSLRFGGRRGWIGRRNWNRNYQAKIKWFLELLWSIRFQIREVLENL